MNAVDFSAAVLSLLTLALIVGSFWFWMAFLQKLKAGETPVPLRFRWNPVRVPRFPLVLTLALLALYFQSLLSRPGRDAELSLKEIQTVVLGTLSEGIVVLGILLPALFLGVRKWTDLARLGLRCDHPGQQMRAGFLGLVAAIIPMGIFLLLTSPLRSTDTEHPFLKLLRETSFGHEMFIILLSAAVIAPLKEELMFRVILQSWLEEFCHPWLAILLTSLTFAAIHGFPDSLALLPLAMTLGYLYQRRRSYLAIVIVHALFNAYNLAATIVGAHAV